MAAIPVVLNGTFTSDQGSTVGVFQGTMAYSDRAPGGGPIVPPSGGEHPEHPIFYPPGSLPHPEHPIAGIDPHPEHPIQLPPDPPTEPPVEPPTNPPSPQWVWGFNPTLNRWLRVYVPGEGQAGPKT